MATASTTAAAAQAAPSKPYDQMKILDGMYSGSIMRLGYVLQDPKNYSESTKIILAECTKKFQDALDDCQIQILDAKWYLERKLAENKARREAEAKAKEATTAPVPAPPKRKHHDVDTADEQQQQQPEGTPTKRPKPTEQPSPNSVAAVANLSTTKDQPIPRDTPQQPAPAALPQAQPMTPSHSQQKEPPKPAVPEKPRPEEQNQPEDKTQPEPQSQQDHFNTDDFIKPTPQATPTLTNDEFNFESMFEGSLEENNDATNNDDGIPFTTVDDTLDQFGPASTAANTNTNPNTASNTQTQVRPQQQQQQAQAQSQPVQSQSQSQSQSSHPFLQGLEQFANQPDDSQNTTTNPSLNLASQPMQNQPSNLSNTSNPFTSNEPNIWDSILDDNFDPSADFGNMDNMAMGVDNTNTTLNMSVGTSNNNTVNVEDYANMNGDMDVGDPGSTNDLNWDDLFES